MARLKGLDAAFLYFESPDQPMHVASLALFELPASYRDRFHHLYRDFLASRINTVDVFYRKLADTPLALDHPVWVEDREFDLDSHVRSMILPDPGTFAQLEQAVARLHSEPLDRTRPLWQFTLIEGLADGRAALYSKFHHAGLDGAAGMLLTQAMYDVKPQARPPAIQPRTPMPEITAGFWGGLSALTVDFLRRQVDGVHRVPEAFRAATNILLPRIPEGATLADVLRRPDRIRLPPLSSPRTILNRKITSERSFAARSLPLASARRVAKATGAKLNDVVLAVCASALRRYLLDRRALPRKPLTAFVPISLRELGNTDMTNQVTGMWVSLATNVADPIERLQAIVASSRNSKRLAGELRDVLRGDISFVGAPVVLTALLRLWGRSGLANWTNPLCNVIISNVPGPPVALYCAEAKVTALYPVSIPAHGIGVNITVQSYIDHLDFGVVAARKLVPDVDRLATYLVEAFHELVALAAPPVPEVPAAEEEHEVVKLRERKRAGRQ